MGKQIIQKIFTGVKKNWLTLAGIGLALMLIFGVVGSCVGDLNYKRLIKAKDNHIVGLEADNEALSEENKALKKSIAETETEIVGIRTELRIKERQNLELVGKNNKWREKVKNMPASTIVLETRRELEFEEVWERPDGILFSLAASRRNLSILGAFTILGERYATLQDAYAMSQAEAKNLIMVIRDERDISANKDKQLANDILIIADWRDKFMLSEGANKRARGKGRKEGGIVGSILGFIIGVLIE